MVNMNKDWLSQLAPAHAPPPPSWWPPAPGWWMLIVLILLIAGVLAYLHKSLANQRRRIALRKLKLLENHEQDDLKLANELTLLLRRYALATYGREATAGLSGDAWLAFLTNHGATDLAGDTGQRLLRAAYGSQVQTDRIRWLTGARQFLRRHK